MLSVQCWNCRFSQEWDKKNLQHVFVVVVLVFYGPSTLIRSFWVRSVNLSTLYLGKPPRQFPVLSAHSITSNWQLPFLNQRKGENGRRNYFITNLHDRMLPDMRIKPVTIRIPGRRASDRATALFIWLSWGRLPFMKPGKNLTYLAWHVSLMSLLKTRPTKWLCAQQRLISLGIHPVWSESLQCAQWVAKDPGFLRADSGLPWVHMPLCWFCQEAVHLKKSAWKPESQTEEQIQGLSSPPICI